jgi:2-dehydro-3-deoxyphosphogluconate aldolase / (4S)-4-hydroxy-2-oxoglutarate aldolase
MNDFLVKALQQRILPVVTIDNVEHALPLTEAFLNASLFTMEITFRTNAAADCVTAISKNFPEMHIGAGTLLTVDTLNKAIDAGAEFGLSSSLNTKVCTAATQKKFPFIPGVMTPSEIELAYELGYDIQKLFPASQIGGASFLKAMLGPYEQLNIQFIPMGGINISNMHEYLQLENVIAIGGSWLASQQMMKEKNFKGIEETVRQALRAIKD